MAALCCKAGTAPLEQSFACRIRQRAAAVWDFAQSSCLIRFKGPRFSAWKSEGFLYGICPACFQDIFFGLVCFLEGQTHRVHFITICTAATKAPSYKSASIKNGRRGKVPRLPFLGVLYPVFNYRPQAFLNSVHACTCASSASALIGWIISVLAASKSCGSVRKPRKSSSISVSAAWLVQ